MLFGYPVEATTENWFHECMVEMLQTIHESIRNGQEPPPWPEIIPLEHLEKLQGRQGLRKRLDKYQDALTELSEDELERVRNALFEQNDIERLLSGECTCNTLNELPESVQEPVKELFEFGFSLLTDLEIRDRQYHVIYERTPYHVCPFCGCEYFDAPGAPREALDHYLAESKYPFAAVNLQNLVPMGNKCNSKYKLAQDILYKDDGTRRRAFYPYENREIHVSLENSEPFEGKDGLFPKWQINFEPNSEEVSTWDEVFHIRERFGRDILDQDFISWLREFSSWCRSANVKHVTDQDIIEALTRYSEHMEAMKMRDRAFLKAVVFRMLYQRCQQGHQRLFDLIKGVVIGGMA